MAKGKSKVNAMTTEMAMPRGPATVEVKKAGNGFVVQQYGPQGQKCMVAKNRTEMQRHVNKLLKG